MFLLSLFLLKKKECKTSWLHSFLSFFSRDKQAAVGSLLRMEVILANTSPLLNTLKKKWSHEVGLDRYLGTFIRESAKLLA